MPERKKVESSNGFEYYIENIKKEEVLQAFEEEGRRKEAAEKLDSGYNCARFEEPWEECLEKGWIESDGRSWQITDKGKEKLKNLEG